MNQDDKQSKETLDSWNKDLNNWVWGIFYYNKDDKRIFPPKKMAWAGWTVNFANPKSVLYLIGMLLFFAFVVSTIPNKH